MTDWMGFRGWERGHGRGDDAEGSGLPDDGRSQPLPRPGHGHALALTG